MEIIAVYNIKGGVGKTTTAVNLAYLSGKEGARTLLWDLDPQGGASYYLCIPPNVKGGAKAIINQKQDPKNLFRMTGFNNLDLLPADFSYRNMEQHLEHQKQPAETLARLLKPLAKNYDRVFLDCSPGINLVSENILHAADILLVPNIPTVLSLRAYNRLVQFLTREHLKRIKVMPFFCMANLTKPVHQAVCKTVPDKHPIFLRTLIPDSPVVEAMGVKRSPVFPYAPDSPAAKAFRDLWEEIKARAQLGKRKVSVQNEFPEDSWKD